MKLYLQTKKVSDTFRNRSCKKKCIKNAWLYVCKSHPLHIFVNVAFILLLILWSITIKFSNYEMRKKYLDLTALCAFTYLIHPCAALFRIYACWAWSEDRPFTKHVHGPCIFYFIASILMMYLCGVACVICWPQHIHPLNIIKRQELWYNKLVAAIYNNSIQCNAPNHCDMTLWCYALGYFVFI